MSNEQTPLINGSRHSWVSIKTNMLGRDMSGIVAIDYDDKQEKANLYGAGRNPVARGKGKYEATAKVTLHGYEVDAIQASLPPGKHLVDIPPFDIIVKYDDEDTDDPIITHVIRNCEFVSNKRSNKQGDTGSEVELELIISHIEW